MDIVIFVHNIFKLSKMLTLNDVEEMLTQMLLEMNILTEHDLSLFSHQINKSGLGSRASVAQKPHSLTRLCTKIFQNYELSV